MNREQAINYLISSGFTHEQVGEVVRALTYEPTTKNDLGVDCISRQSRPVIHANWLSGDCKGAHCSNCEEYTPFVYGAYNFCPNCGADMREVEE